MVNDEEFTPGRLFLSWEDVEDMVKVLAEVVRKAPVIVDSIYGIPRGGLIPATLLSHKLNIPMVEVPTESTLVVDDIVDSGLTLSQYAKYSFACLVYKPLTSHLIPTFFALNYVQDYWINFPWEEKNSEKIPDRELEK
jgi:uncharacterized protein